MRAFDLALNPLTGRHLIEAGAGTGKTFTLAHLYLRLILERGVPVERILVVTFTEAATAELRTRIHTLLTQALQRCRSGTGDTDTVLDAILASSRQDAATRLERALYVFDDAAICTIHGFCQRMLLENAFETGSLFSTELIGDQDALISEAAEDFWRSRCLRHERLFTGFLLDHQCTVETLIRALADRALHPILTIIPHETRWPDTAAQEKRFLKRYADLQAAWDAYGDDAVRYLLEGNDVKRSVYRPDTVRSATTRMHSFLRTPPDSPVLSSHVKRLELFTTDKLRASLKKGATGPGLMDLFDACQGLMEAAEQLQHAYSIRLASLRNDFVSSLRSTVRERKIERHVKSFDDLLTELEQALRRGSGPRLARAIQRRYQAALIDEFQDTDEIQYTIFSRVFSAADSTLFLIGDPKQAIYGFRGADVFTYMRAKTDTPGDNRYTLLVNHRASPELVAAVNGLFSWHRTPFVFEGIPFTKGMAADDAHQRPQLHVEQHAPAPLHVWFLPGIANDKGEVKPVPSSTADAHLAKAIAAECARLLNLASEGRARIGDTPVRPADIAVLIRKNSQAALVRQALLELRVPAVMYGMGSVYESEEATEMQHILAAVLDPSNVQLVRAALATHALGWSGRHIAELHDDDTRMASLLERFVTYNRTWSVSGFAAMYRCFWSDFDVPVNLLRHQDGERRLTNFGHLAELLQTTASDDGMGMQELAGWLARRRVDPAAHRESHELRLDSDENAVTIVTIHRAKGLQYPVVFCPFVMGGSEPRPDDVVFHDHDNGDRLTFDHGSESIAHSRRCAAREQLAENVRLLYVGLTRAKYLCYTAWGMVNNAWTSAPAYLFHGEGIDNSDDMVERLRERVKRLGGDDIRGALQRLAAHSRGTIAVQECQSLPAAPYHSTRSPAPSLHAHRFSTHVRARRSVASFSAIAHARHDGDEEAADYDPLATNSVPPIPLRQSAHDTIFDFPRGARAGTCLHRVFELIDFEQPSNPQTVSIVRRTLSEFHFEERWVPVVSHLIERICCTPLPHGLMLRNVGPGDRIDETEFFFPLERTTPGSLRDMFGRHTTPLPANGLSTMLERLAFSSLEGFMHGFVDCICRHAGRYYLIDWKSNFLGNTPNDYAADSLARTMVREYYFLQYHIYAVALHRYLSSRLPGYRYAHHFGGVLYLFVRGMTGSAGTGVYYDLPNEALIEDLGKRLAGRGTRRASG